MLKELLLLPTEVGGLRLNRDGSEVFHLVIRNSWWREYGCAAATILNTAYW
jgi:hypothetical protein